MIFFYDDLTLPTFGRTLSIKRIFFKFLSGPGLMVARERSREPYFWENVKHKDRAHNKSFRKLSGIEDEARPITSWDRGGRMKLAPSLWSELFPMWIGRILDMIDCFYIAAGRDATPRDALHQSFTWNISQNVTREAFRTATPGVCGCVTPGGDLLVPHLGRTLLGFEKLLLQGKVFGNQLPPRHFHLDQFMILIQFDFSLE